MVLNVEAIYRTIQDRNLVKNVCRGTINSFDTKKFLDIIDKSGLYECGEDMINYRNWLKQYKFNLENLNSEKHYFDA